MLLGPSGPYRAPVHDTSTTLRLRPMRAVLLLLVPAFLSAQTAEPAALPVGWSVFMGPSASAFTGGPATSGGYGGSFGVAKERPIGTATTLRSEFLVGGAAGSIGEIGDLIPEPATLTSSRMGLGAGVRRYSAGRAYVGIGATVSIDTGCFVDLPAGASFYGQTLECTEVTDYDIAPAGANVGSVLTAGLSRGKWNLEIRYDQGITPVVRTDRGDLTSRQVGAMLHYRFGREAQTGVPNIQKPRANAPLPGQLMAGFLGWSAGLVGGMLVGAVISDEPGQDFTPLLTGLVGTFVGTPIGVHMYGARHGTRANPLPTIAGTILGGMAGPAIPYTMPLGAVIGYNTTSRER